MVGLKNVDKYHRKIHGGDTKLFKLIWKEEEEKRKRVIEDSKSSISKLKNVAVVTQNNKKLKMKITDVLKECSSLIHTYLTRGPNWITEYHTADLFMREIETADRYKLRMTQ